MKKATRWKRRILREHRANPDRYIHSVFLVSLTQPGDKFKASIHGFRMCARCKAAREEPGGWRGLKPLMPPIVDECVASPHISWDDLKRELFPNSEDVD